jgi:uroporphyrinogen decarboxylase
VVSEQMMRKLSADVVGVYSKPPNSWHFRLEPKSKTYIDEWGIVYKLTEDGLYFDILEPALKNVNAEILNRYSWPDPYDPSRYEGMVEKARYYFEKTDYAVSVGGTFGGGLLQDGAWLVGFANWFSLLLLEPDLAERIMDKILDFHIGYWEAVLKRIGRYVQIVVIADDLGTQDSLFISRELMERYLKPKYKRLIGAIKNCADVKVLIHSDGAIEEVIPDLIEAGVDILNPVQVSARGMGDTHLLKEKYGDHIVFWGGGCDTQRILSFGSPEQVEQEVRNRMLDLKPGGGFVFAPVHNIQPEVPIENVLQLYRAALEYGKY